MRTLRHVSWLLNPHLESRSSRITFPRHGLLAKRVQNRMFPILVRKEMRNVEELDPKPFLELLNGMGLPSRIKDDHGDRALTL